MTIWGQDVDLELKNTSNNGYIVIESGMTIGGQYVNLELKILPTTVV